MNGQNKKLSDDLSGLELKQMIKSGKISVSDLSELNLYALIEHETAQAEAYPDYDFSLLESCAEALKKTRPEKLDDDPKVLKKRNRMIFDIISSYSEEGARSGKSPRRKKPSDRVAAKSSRPAGRRTFSKQNLKILFAATVTAAFLAFSLTAVSDYNPFSSFVQSVRNIFENEGQSVYSNESGDRLTVDKSFKTYSSFEELLADSDEEIKYPDFEALGGEVKDINRSITNTDFIKAKLLFDDRSVTFTVTFGEAAVKNMINESFASYKIEVSDSEFYGIQTDGKYQFDGEIDGVLYSFFSESYDLIKTLIETLK